MIHETKEKAARFFAQPPFRGMAGKISRIACALIAALMIAGIASCGGGGGPKGLAKQTYQLSQEAEKYADDPTSAKALAAATKAAKIAAEVAKLSPADQEVYAAELAALAMGGASSGGGGAAVKGTGKNYTLSKPEDFKYDLTKIDGKDYVVIKKVNLPSDFQKPKSSGSNTVLIDTLTVKIPEKIEGYTVGAVGSFLVDINALEALVAVTIPDTVVEIEDSAFKDASISSIKLPKNLKKLGDRAFNGCENLGGKLVIPEGVTEIPDSCFFRASITELTIPESVTSIGWWAFYDCKELTTVKLPSHPIKYGSKNGNGVFEGCSKLSLAVRKAIEESGYKDRF